MYENALLVVSG